MSHEQVRRHTSLTPASNSQKQWVESNRSNLTIIENIMSEVQKDRQYHIPIAHIDIVSSNTGVSQYLRAPLIPWNSNPRSSSDLRLLLKPAVGQSFLTDELEARAAAYLYWVVLQPVLLSSELNEIMQNTVVALKREGKQTFSSLASGQQGALQLALKPLQNISTDGTSVSLWWKRLENAFTPLLFILYFILFIHSAILHSQFTHTIHLVYYSLLSFCVYFTTPSMC